MEVINQMNGNKNNNFTDNFTNVEIPGENASNEWLEPVTDEEYDNL